MVLAHYPAFKIITLKIVITTIKKSITWKYLWNFYINPKLNIELTTTRYTHLEVDAVGIFVIEKVIKQIRVFIWRTIKTYIKLYNIMILQDWQSDRQTYSECTTYV